MFVCRSVEEFYEKNKKEMERIVTWVTGLRQGEEFEDILQDFYLELMKRKSLERFEPLESEIETNKMFNSYVFTCFGNFISSRNRALSVRVGAKDCVSVIKFRKNNGEASKSEDVFDHLGKAAFSASSSRDSKMEVSHHHRYDCWRADEEKEVSILVEDFKSYLGEIKESDTKRRRMIKYVGWAENDLNSRSLAESEGVSDSYIKDIKKALHAHAQRFVSES